MILAPNSKILVVHRRLFEMDHPRYFVGAVDGYENGLAKITGFTWVYDVMEGRFEKKKSLRTKIFSILSGTVFCYELPIDLNIPAVEFVHSGNSVVLTDHKKFSMDLSENFRVRHRD